MGEQNLLRAKFALSNFYKARSQEKKVLACYLLNSGGYIPTMTQISRELDVRKQHVSRAFRELMSKGYVEKFSERKIAYGLGSKTPVYRFTKWFEGQFQHWKESSTSYQNWDENNQAGEQSVTIDGEQQENNNYQQGEINFKQARDFWSKEKGE